MGTADLIGRTFGAYKVTGVLGSGGMADVFRARHGETNREVALKILPREYAMDGKHLARFKREIEQSSRLEHPNLCKVLDWGEAEGVHFYCMEVIEGQDLEAYITGRDEIRLDEVYGIIRELCTALVYLHERSIIHRDIKPTNIFLRPNGQVVLADFGLLKDITEQDITGDNTRLGTPTYMSPEQFKGSKIDHRTDIYQLGIVFYKLLTGVTPFEGDSFFALGIKVMTKRIPSPQKYNPAIPDEVQDIIMKACEKLPEDRYESARDLAAAINRYFARREMGQALDRARGDAGAAASAAAPAAALPSSPPSSSPPSPPPGESPADALQAAVSSVAAASPEPPVPEADAGDDEASPRAPAPLPPRKGQGRRRQPAATAPAGRPRSPGGVPGGGGYDPFGLGAGAPRTGGFSRGVVGSGVANLEGRSKTSSVVLKPVTAYREGVLPSRTLTGGEWALVVLSGLAMAVAAHPLVLMGLPDPAAWGACGGGALLVLAVYALGLRDALTGYDMLRAAAVVWSGAVIALNLLGPEGRELLPGVAAADAVAPMAVVSVAVGFSYLSRSTMLSRGHRWALGVAGSYSLVWLVGWVRAGFSFKDVLLVEFRAVEEGVLRGMLTPTQATFYVMCYVFLPLTGLAALVEVVWLMTRKEMDRAMSVFVEFLALFAALFFLLHLEKVLTVEFVRYNPM